MSEVCFPATCCRQEAEVSALYAKHRQVSVESMPGVKHRLLMLQDSYNVGDRVQHFLG